MAGILETNDKDFKQDVLNTTDNLVLVDFFAPWCGPCKALGPILEEVSKEIPEVKFLKLNVDENPYSAQNYGINGIPALIIFKNGKPVQNHVGLVNKESLKKLIDSAKQA